MRCGAYVPPRRQARQPDQGYGPKDVERAAAFADPALMSVDVQRGGRDTVAS
ncbi:MAG: hypothetical protein ICV69_03890 [Thermoleophilaceae bacterium]|nr:hypothetical protein [Thermoleophilaceae bacterium]